MSSWNNGCGAPPSNCPTCCLVWTLPAAPLVPRAPWGSLTSDARTRALARVVYRADMDAAFADLSTAQTSNKRKHDASKAASAKFVQAQPSSAVNFTNLCSKALLGHVAGLAEEGHSVVCSFPKDALGS
eukprot:53219-Alexandrium_andersonii.AAC.1